MNQLKNKYYQDLIAEDNLDAQDDRLLIAKEGSLSIHYAPFEYINTSARLVIVGLTPGIHQATVSLNAFREAILKGESHEKALKDAKETASFSGPMRNNLINILNHINVNKVIGIDDCAQLFDIRRDLVHYTSVIRNPAFKNGKNYSGSPRVLSNALLNNHLNGCFYEECKQLPDAIYLPLGSEVVSVLEDMVKKDILCESQILFGLPHPSGANAERIAYFLGKKDKSDLSVKTNPDTIDLNRGSLIQKMKEFN